MPPEIDDAGWTPTPGAAEPLDEFEMHDLELIADVTHPVRGSIVRRLHQPRTVAELADLLDVPVTRLYHHVNRLEERGLIRVVATRRVAAVTERRYQVVARSYRIAPELFHTMDDREMAIAMGSLFDVAKLGLQREIEGGGYRNVTAPEEHSCLSLGEISVSPARRAELLRRLTDIVREFGSDTDEDAPDATRMTLFVAAYPETF
ncbi:MAG: helix-turn-helix domain-containing protein [Ilumatobacter sp.]|uniref:winged helix-turn-helix domain-containing protein n=1 Tax=Ilumatobacter sp. TaxID=1967498 RepID=UPI00260E5FAE|nr:helix-turn-helix domain-containing protein [Ilumatobacter sp.]MDJ0769231.1 helix-turn-helix domain-containing protein [Ilumatobacter sp.]